MSTEIMEKTEEILKEIEIPDRHTFFQIEKFMIGKEPTAQGQLWAIVRELQARKETVENFRKDLADAEDNLELFDLKIEVLNRQMRIFNVGTTVKYGAEKQPVNSDLNMQECAINIRKLERDKEALVKAAQKVNQKMKYVMEEMAFLAAGYEKIVAQSGPMKPVDDEAAQKELWNEKLLEEFNLRIILQRPLDPEFVKTILCLNDDAQVKKQMIGVINQIQNKMILEKKQAESLPRTQAQPQVQPKAQTTGK